MTKYKLIKKFPNSPDIGFEVEERYNDRQITFLYPLGKYYEGILKSNERQIHTLTYSVESIESYPEFWQKVEEKDYEILSFRNKVEKGNFIWNKNEKGLFERLNFNERLIESPESDFQKREVYEIYSIKRLSDGEIFTIGDRLIHNDFHYLGDFILKEIKFESAPANKGTGKLSFIHNHPTLGKWLQLKNLQKSKQKLFTTEDGVKIYEKFTDVYAVEKDKFKLFESPYGKSIGTWLNGWYTTDKLPNPKEEDIFNGTIITLISEKYKLFSTKEKAEEWIYLNKPSLSPQQVFDYINKQTNSSFNIDNCHPDFAKLIKENATK